MMNEINYSWKAYYDDGSFLSQYDNNHENLFRDIDQGRLVNFIISKNHSGDGLGTEDFCVSVRSGVLVLRGIKITFGEYDTNRLIYFRRVKKTLTLNIGGLEHESTFHVIGLQATINGKNSKIMFGINDVNGGIRVEKSK